MRSSRTARLRLLLALISVAAALGPAAAQVIAQADAQVVVSGVVTGYDGKPMRTAQVQLVNAAAELIDSTTAGLDGTFQLRASRPGLLRIQFAGPLHEQKEVFFLTDRSGTFSLRAQLTAPEYSTELVNLRLSTSDPKSPLNDTPFERQPDGTFIAQIESSAQELMLAVTGFVKSGPPLAIPGYSEYRCLNNRNCYAVVRPASGQLHVALDPKLLVRTTEPASIRYRNPESAVAVAGSIIDEAETFNTARRVARQATALKLGKALDQVPLEPPPAEMVTAVRQAIGRERVALVRQARLFEYLLLVFQGAPADGALVTRALVELTPASPLWPLNFGNVLGSAIIATGEPEKHIDYGMRVMDAQSSKALKGNTAAGIITAFGMSGLAAAAQPLIAKAKTEVGDQNIVKAVLATYGTESRIAKGKSVPAFRAPSFDDPLSAYTEASLKGKVYLIDFWATWCPPCIAEFPGLTKLHEKYERQGFEVLSYSVDSNREAVSRFRKERFGLPWLHAIDPQLRELQSPMAKDFDVLALPRPLLVDATGIIVAIDEECRGAKLEELLKRLLPPPAVAQ
jgi:thiol-disulfide isomerase/thioredoxin